MIGCLILKKWVIVSFISVSTISLLLANRQAVVLGLKEEIVTKYDTNGAQDCSIEENIDSYDSSSSSLSSSKKEDEIIDQLNKKQVLRDIQRSMQMMTQELRLLSEVTQAINDFTKLWSIDDADEIFSKASIGDRMFLFLHGLATSNEFRTTFWQKHPLFLPSSDMKMNDTDHHHFRKSIESFTVSNDVLPAFVANDGSFFAPYVPKKKNLVNTWSTIIATEYEDDDQDQDENLSPFLSLEKVQDHISTHTSYFVEAGTKFPKIGALNRLANHAFGLPVTTNIYISPVGLQSIPLHSDPQDIFIFQTESVQHWYVYFPPPTKANIDPYNRGKNGDIIQSQEIPNKPLIDTILCPGDVLYIPAGFPHSADTIVRSEIVESICGMERDTVLDKSDHSLHLTLGIDTQHWALTYAHLRYNLLTKFQLKIEQLTVENKAHWESMRTLNVGFLFKHWQRNDYGESSIDGRKTSTEDDTLLRTDIIQNLKKTMTQLEPNRWRWKSGTELMDSEKTSGETSGRENMPSMEKFHELIDFVIEEHLPNILVLQSQMNNITIEMNKYELLTRMKRIKTLQHYIMKEYWTFSDDKFMMSYYRS